MFSIVLTPVVFLSPPSTARPGAQAGIRLPEHDPARASTHALHADSPNPYATLNVVHDSRPLDAFIGYPVEQQCVIPGERSRVFREIGNTGYAIKVYDDTHTAARPERGLARANHEVACFNALYGPGGAEVFVTCDARLCVRMRLLAGMPVRGMLPSALGSKAQVNESLYALRRQLIESGVIHHGLHAENLLYHEGAFLPIGFREAYVTPVKSHSLFAVNDCQLDYTRHQLFALIDSRSPEIAETTATRADLLGEDVAQALHPRCGYVSPDPRDASQVYKLLFRFHLPDFWAGAPEGPAKLGRAIREKRMFEAYYGEGSARLVRTRDGDIFLHMQRMTGKPLTAGTVDADKLYDLLFAMNERLLARGILHAGCFANSGVLFDAATDRLNPLSFGDAWPSPDVPEARADARHSG